MYSGERTRSRRAIGPAGTMARTAVGLFLTGSVVAGQARGGFHPGAFVLGLAVFPALAALPLAVRARRNATPLRATGPLAHVLNLAVFLALYLTWWYAPELAVTSDAALLFYGASMLIAALGGYGGCEVTTISNWLLHRDDRIGCALFLPIDLLERRHGGCQGMDARSIRPLRNRP